jgi:hypothetical protein
MQNQAQAQRAATAANSQNQSTAPRFKKGTSYRQNRFEGLRGRQSTQSIDWTPDQILLIKSWAKIIRANVDSDLFFKLFGIHIKQNEGIFDCLVTCRRADNFPEAVLEVATQLKLQGYDQIANQF